MKRIQFSFVLAALSVSAVLVLNGCGSPAQRIDPAGDRGLVTTQDINTRDWGEVSKKCVDSMLSAGVLNRADGRKSVVMVSTVKDRTRRGAKTTILTNKIRQSLLASGKAVATTALGASGAEDNATRQVRELENDDLFNTKTVQKRGTVIAPDLSLSGEIVQDEARDGRKIESNFVFHVVVTDLKTGLAVWEDTFEITKQETRSLF